jgi:hypothetical protein
MIAQNTFFKNSILFIIGIFLCIPVLVLGQTNPTTQQVWDPTANAFITVPASWNVSAGNWASLQSIFNPVTNTWIQVPLTWTVPASTTADSQDWVTPTAAWQVPGASSDPLNPNIIQTATPTIGVPITDNNKTVGSILRLATTVIQTLLPVLLGLSTVIFMISIIAMIKDSDNEEKRTQAKKVMIQSIFALFVLISAWGLVAVLSGTFGFEFGLPQLSA